MDLISNLVTHSVLSRDGATANLLGNLAGQSPSLFVDGPGGDFHLNASATTAIEQGVAVEARLCGDDMDGDPRPVGAGRDVVADESGTPWPLLLPAIVKQ